MTEIVRQDPHQNHSTDLALDQQMRYAEAVAYSDMIPQAYRGKPANVLIAIGLGASMGLSQAESLYRIDVIQGKPTAAAELIASNVRKAGHKLRVHTDKTAMSVRAVIIRADDPDYEYEVVRDMAWAREMGLATKDNYKKQPLTMLQWRAISAVARLACSEALYGVVYTPDEMFDFGGPRRADTAPPVAPPAQARTVSRQRQPEREVVEVIHQDDTPTTPDPAPESTGEPAPSPSTRSQWSRLGNALDAVGITGKADKTEAMRSWAVEQGITTVINSAKDLTSEQAEALIAELEADPDAQSGATDGQWETVEVAQ